MKEQYLTDLVEKLNVLCSDDESFNLFIHSFIVQNFDYSPDYVNYGIFDWITYPLETMDKGSGDCEDLGIFLLSLLKAAGYDCGFILFSDHLLPIASGTIHDQIANGDLSQFSINVGGREYIAFETSYGLSCPVGYTDKRYSIQDVIVIHIL